MPVIDYSSGPLYPGTAADGGGPDVVWTNPNNAKVDDGVNATTGSGAGGWVSNELLLTNFGFTVPTNSVVDGVKMEFQRSYSSAQDMDIFLIKSGVTVGNDKAGTGVTAGDYISYGNSNDLWGTTLTPAQVNASNFGVSIQVQNTSGGGSANIDVVRITVYWHYVIDVAAADVPTRFLYKMHDSQDQYLGNLPTPKNDFGLPQDINSAGSAITIEVPYSPDTAVSETDYLITEAGDYITDESNNRIRIDRPSLISVGTGNSGALLQNGNRVYVYMYNYYYPNGKLMFSGQVNRVEASFGGDSEDGVNLLVLSDGLDFDNLIARGSPFAYTADVTQNTATNTLTINQARASHNRYGQTWVCGVGVTKLGAITIYLDGSANVTVTVYDGPNGTVLGSASKFVDTAVTGVVTQFGFPSLITVVPGNSYFFAVSVDDEQSILIGYSTANPYANGSMYNSSYGGGSGGGSYIISLGNDLYFVASAGTATTTATYSSKDPTIGMLKPIIDDYIVRGGLINYSSSSVDATGLSLTVTFNTETILDAIKRILSVSPSNFYWYVDLGTNIIYFKQTSTTADFTLIKGRNLQSINLVMSIENTKNKFLFSGGATAGVNLYSEYNDQSSQTSFGARLERKSDNRVTVQATANAIGNSFLNVNKNETQETQVTVMGADMDLTLLKPGKTVGLRGFGSFIDNFLMQIVRIEYHVEYAVLSLGVMPLRQSDKVEAITRGLIAEQTVANPSTPS